MIRSRETSSKLGEGEQIRSTMVSREDSSFLPEVLGCLGEHHLMNSLRNRYHVSQVMSRHGSKAREQMIHLGVEASDKGRQ